MAVLIPPAPFTPMAWQRRARPSALPQPVTAADTGTGTETAAVTAAVSSADTGSGADSAAGRPLMRVRWSAPDKISIKGGTMHP